MYAVGTSRDAGTVIKWEYKCRDGKCDVSVSFIVRDDPRWTPPASVVQIQMVESAEELQGNTPPKPLPVSTSSPVDGREGAAQAVTALDRTSGITEDAHVETLSSQPVTTANSEHVSIEDIQEGPQPDAKHDTAESVAKDQQPTALSDIVQEAATDAEKIKSIRDRLGNSVDYLEGVMKLGEFISEVSPG